MTVNTDYERAKINLEFEKKLKILSIFIDSLVSLFNQTLVISMSIE